jgi:hypothetical protein
MQRLAHDTLKQRHREVRNGYPANLNLRIHRALSWWQRAGQCDDDDGRFIFLWIAFNAAYAQDLSENFRSSARASFRAFFEKLCGLDRENRIGSLVWQEFSSGIRVLLDTPFVLQSFWDFHSGKIAEAQWQERFAADKKTAARALAGGNTPALLGVVFSRLYTLRNQLMHGGATWNSSVNRKQLHDCAELLGKLVPLIIELMLDHPKTLWGDACYPVVGAL